MGIIGVVFALGLFALGNPPALGQAADSPAAEVDNLKINGEVDGEKAGFVITGDFKPRKSEEEKEKLIFSARTENIITHRRGQTEQIISGTVKILQGETAELRFRREGQRERWFRPRASRRSSGGCETTRAASVISCCGSIPRNRPGAR